MRQFCLATITVIFPLLCSTGLEAQTTQPKPNKVCLDNTEQLSITSKYVEGETHISVYSTALTNGLKIIFKR